MEKTTPRKKSKCAYIVGSSLVITTLLSSCALLPKEAEERQVLVVNTVEQEEYELVMVKRDTVVESQSIYCTYSRLDGEELRFVTEGLTVEKVNVIVGDKVKQGDLLAELSMGDSTDRMTELKQTIEADEIRTRRTKNLLSLELQKLKVLYEEKNLTEKEYQEAVAETKASYHKTLQVYEDALYINNLKFEEVTKQLQNGRIYAASEGTVSFMQQNLLGSKSTATVPSIIVSSNEDCAFLATSDYADYFAEGDNVEVTTAGGTVYETIVSHDPKVKNAIVFELVVPDFGLKVDSKAVAILVLNERKDVMTLPSIAIRKGNEFHYVYLRDSDGMKVMREVTVGLSGNGITEILDGLSLGDVVIKK